MEQVGLLLTRPTLLAPSATGVREDQTNTQQWKRHCIKPAARLGDRLDKLDLAARRCFYYRPEVWVVENPELRFVFPSGRHQDTTELQIPERVYYFRVVMAPTDL